MFANTIALLLTISALAVQACDPSRPIPVQQCPPGHLQCCNSVQSTPSQSTTLLLGLLGIVDSPSDYPIGIGCTPISIIGVGGGGNCAQQPVCCDNNNFNGLINLCCVPVLL